MLQSSSSSAPPLTIRHIDGLDAIDPGEWSSLNSDNNPFLSYAYLNGLETHGCLDGHGWNPSHIAVFSGKKLVGALPVYIKTNSYGEFVFDWSWADAYERAGGRYYPKLVSAIPFAPVRGARLLVNGGYKDTQSVKRLLVKEVIETVNRAELSSFHCLFSGQSDTDLFLQEGMLLRKTCQFHWHNRGYRDFQDFLDALSSKKRKQIKRERRQVADNGIEIEVLSGDRISDTQWRAFYEFYCATFHKRWGSPRLTYDFFLSLTEKLPEQTLLILAKHRRDYVAGAFAMLDDNNLYGRHWGCNAQYPYLHFELCYYQTIEYCIQHGLATLDAGVQGEHKLSRGFSPVATRSCHWIRHQGFRDAIRDFLERETPAVEAYIAELNNHLPYKETGGRT